MMSFVQCESHCVTHIPKIDQCAQIQNEKYSGVLFLSFVNEVIFVVTLPFVFFFFLFIVRMFFYASASRSWPTLILFDSSPSIVYSIGSTISNDTFIYSGSVSFP